MSWVNPPPEGNNPASHSRRGVVEYYVRRTTPVRNQGWFVRFDRGGSQGGIWRDLVVIRDDPGFDALEALK
jgi:hypothetical protein